MVFLSDEELCNKIDNNNYTLFDKILCGGLGYGSFCMPTMIFKIIFTIIFPPIGILINNLNPDRKTPLEEGFPYLNKDHFMNIFSKIDEFIIAFILTMLFYVPGLIYVMTKFKTAGEVFEEVDINDDNKEDNFGNTEQIEKNEDDEDEEYKNIDLNKLRKELLGNK